MAARVKRSRRAAAKRASAGKDPLAVLEVIDRLEVGPVRVEKRRIVAPYVVTQGKKRQRFELIYRWEENVFEAGDAEAANLAALIAAQPALNYGLFCREIVFRGPLDATDRKFLQAMARNTAREIYVKKFLEPNEFLRPPAVGLPALQRPSYVRAKLFFPDALPRRARAARWATDRSRHAVLSSGGKDSLLSFGLLRELGLPADAIYINESGRHWFTALNAHRFMAGAFPGTARVWTNADRLFAWMLRRLPFVRRDFQDVRSDEYPIRLWTVAVFLFGALPLMRKRGLARLVIGDEIDTSRRATHAGITHYDGLFDQSRWFDDAMSRFYADKGWGVAQFSILRPLSELLIQKILVQRYPELQEHQVSCHATHSVEGRARPCGVCEKCRRIVGMLLAVGADPARCGYTAAQVTDVLAQLAQKGVAQEAETAEQVLWMLQSQGRWQPSAADVRPPRERPEALALRFDPERSTFDDIPVDLRAPLWRIYLQYAQGALRRSGRVWLPFDLLADAQLRQPYPYERGAETAPGAPAADEVSGPRPWMLGELTWPAAERRFKEVDVALLPVGSFEQHGPHLPLDVDAFDAEYLAQQIGARCSDPKPLVLPLIPYGVSYNHDDFPGTLSVGPETLARMVHEIGLSVARHGVTKLVIINGHGGNVPALRFAAQMINRDAHIFTCVDTGESSDEDVGKLTATSNDVHAGEVETSTTMALRPHLVPMERARKHVPGFSSAYLDFSSARAVEWFARTARISRSGVMGDPTRATREKGAAMWEVMIRNLVEFVEQLKGMSLDEIWQKRY
jgi:creatinine amidohydrolase/Fe(II)-dependent formamide hydrolase-like protein